jgi:uncharacterized protein YkwD
MRHPERSEGSLQRHSRRERRPFAALRVTGFVALFLVPAIAFAAEDSREITVASVIAQMNVYRAGKGLPPLVEESRLTRSAQDRMRDMEELGYWAHVAPDGRSPFTWLRANGYEHAYAAENLASGFETVQILLEGWMESPGHRDNIISPIFNECGVAIIEGGTTGRSDGKSVVVLFGRQRSE